MRRTPQDPRCLVIVPTPFSDDYEPDSVDLRLGLHFLVPTGHRAPCFCPGRTPAELLYEEEYVPLGGFIVVPAHSTVLGATLEFIKLPCDMAGEILTKSSWARTFITIETAPWVHPLYRGCLTLEIANASNTPIILYPGIKIAQLVLLRSACSRGKEPRGPEECDDCRDDKASGTYVGPVRPEPGAIRAPEEFLLRMGVQKPQIATPEAIFRSPKG